MSAVAEAGTDVDVVVLEQLDFQPPCENPDGCPRPAEGIIRSGCGCWTVLSCVPCWEQFLEVLKTAPPQLQWLCRSCDAPMSPESCSWEPLKKGDS